MRSKFESALCGSGIGFPRTRDQHVINQFGTVWLIKEAMNRANGHTQRARRAKKAAGSDAHRLAALVRFLARRAAERDYASMSAAEGEGRGTRTDKGE